MSAVRAPAAEELGLPDPPAAVALGRLGRRRDYRRRVLVHLFQLLVVVAFVGLWEAGSVAHILDPFFFSEPSQIARNVWGQVSSGSILPNLAATLEESALGLAIGAAGGVAVGVLLAQVRVLSEVFDPFIKIANSLPRLVFAPLFMLWFGLGTWSKVWLAVSLVFFLVFFNTFQGIREVQRVLIDNARMLGASRWQLLRHVLIPSALSWIFSSLHVSVGFAIIGAVVGEYLGANRGIGYLIAQAQGNFNTTAVFGGLVILAVVVAVVDVLVSRLERRLLRWKPSERRTAQPGA